MDRINTLVLAALFVGLFLIPVTNAATKDDGFWLEANAFLRIQCEETGLSQTQLESKISTGLRELGDVHVNYSGGTDSYFLFLECVPVAIGDKTIGYAYHLLITEKAHSNALELELMRVSEDLSAFYNRLSGDDVKIKYKLLAVISSEEPEKTIASEVVAHFDRHIMFDLRKFEDAVDKSNAAIKAKNEDS